MNYTYRITKRGLCSELNSLLGYYESIIDEDCKVYVDGGNSQYFKDVSIYDVFDFPSNFVKEKPSEATMVSSNEWKKTALNRYEFSISPSDAARFFNYTKSFRERINRTMNRVELPVVFNCFHIRRGDKIGEAYDTRFETKGLKEASRYEFEYYFNRCDQSIKSIFIMTDDYEVITEAKHYINQNKLDHKIFHLTTKTQTGHSTDTDIKNNRTFTNRELLNFFTEIEIAKHSHQFVGTGSSNIFRYIKNQCTTNVKLISIDI
tara:strand:+ start:123 stop:908 length:786 start_codon:yes stop_codon:yes gene_type:complete